MRPFHNLRVYVFFLLTWRISEAGQATAESNFQQRAPFHLTSDTTMPGKQFFTDEEKESLTQLVRRYRSSVENKKSDAVSLTQKTKAWNDLCADYNSGENVRPRTVGQLRKLWDNMKQKWKKEKAKQIRDAMATGELVSFLKVCICSKR